jgi:hypothetical protein
MSAVYDRDEWADALCTEEEDAFADERAEDKKRRDFERLAEHEYRETGAMFVWDDGALDDDEAEGDA